jgi:hypothetical protein
MSLLINFARYEIGILLVAFTGVIAYKFLTGGIETRGMLSEKTKAGVGGVSAARVQLFLLTMAMAFYVLAQVIELRKFPEIETKWLLMLGGSHSVYLGAKGVLSLFTSEPK